MKDPRKLVPYLSGTHPVSGAWDADPVACAAQFNEEDIDKINPLSSTELLAWSAGKSAGDRPRIIKIREAAAVHVNEDVKAIAIAADLMISRDNTVLDLNLADRAAMVADLVAGSVLSAADSTSLYALATTKISFAAQEELGQVRPGNIVEARN